MTIPRTVTIIPYDGEPDNWSSWEQTFITQADMMGFADVMEGTTAIPKESYTCSTNALKTSRTMNKTEIFVLTASMESQENKDIIFESSTPDNKRGYF